MPLTRQNFEMLAAALRETRPVKAKDAAAIAVDWLEEQSKFSPEAIQSLREGGTALGAWKATVERIAQRLKDDNPRFDKARFMRAVGYES